MPEHRPAARTSAARDNVAYANVYRPGSLERIRSLIPETSLHAIDHQSGFSWQAFESPGYLHCWHGIGQGVFDLEKPSGGRVKFEIDEPGRLARATFSWR